MSGCPMHLQRSYFAYRFTLLPNVRPHVHTKDMYVKQSTLLKKYFKINICQQHQQLTICYLEFVKKTYFSHSSMVTKTEVKWACNSKA